MSLFTQLFLLLLALGIALQLWLLQRHLAHVANHRQQVPAAFSDRVTLDEHRRAADYTLAKGRLMRVEILFGGTLLLLWTLGGGIDLLDVFWRGFAWSELLTGLLLCFTFYFINGLLELPFNLLHTFRIEAAFGFNRTTALQFIKDLLLGALLAILLGGPLLWIILWLMQWMQNTWWLAAWAVWMAFALILSWAYPRLISPLFNRFEPLGEGELRQRIQRLLQRCDFASDGIFVMDGSKRSSHGNAYFTGIGRHKRIVFFDTLLEQLTVDETEAVLAHELGHFRHHHFHKQILLMAVLSLAGLALLGWLSRQSWFYAGLGVTHRSNAAALLLFMLASPVFTLFFSPLGSYLSRRYEFEADDYAVAHTGGEFLTHALVKVYRDSAKTLTPDPLYSLFYDRHPPAPVRIAHINQQAAGQ
jgi:STE24 endopeptidase